MRNLKMQVRRHPFKESYDLSIYWDGINGTRRMLIDIENGEINIPREGIEDIARLCDEFLKDKDFRQSYLKISK